MTTRRSISVAQTCAVRGDVDANLDEHLRLTELAVSAGAQVVVFPELSLTGYELELAEELAFSPDDPRLERLVDAASSGSVTLVVGAPIRLEGRLHIAALLFSPDRTIAVYTKHFLGAFGDSARCDGIVPPAEATVFQPGDRNPLLRFGGNTAALAVCADIGRPSHAQQAVNRGAQAYLASMFVIPSEFEGDAAKLSGYATQHSIVVALANFGGPTGGLAAAGRSSIWSQTGALLARLSSCGAGVAVATETTAGWRASMAMLGDDRRFPQRSARAPGDRPRLPAAPRSIQKGSSLASLLDVEAVECLAHNLALAHPAFNGEAFCRAAIEGLAPLGILQRGRHLASVLRAHLPAIYQDAVAILIRSLTPPNVETEDLGLGVFFYLPHVSFVAAHGLDASGNGGRDPFEVSMTAQYELTRRFSAEFSLRPFLIEQQERTLARLREWTGDPDPHVRRLCSEGTRPRLPWARRIPAFVSDPRPVLPVLEALKDDASLYVRRSVANHLGDIAKDHPQLVFEICERWLVGASAERNWVIRHAVRHPARKGVRAALRLRERAQ